MIRLSILRHSRNKKTLLPIGAIWRLYFVTYLNFRLLTSVLQSSALAGHNPFVVANVYSSCYFDTGQVRSSPPVDQPYCVRNVIVHKRPYLL